MPSRLIALGTFPTVTVIAKPMWHVHWKFRPVKTRARGIPRVDFFEGSPRKTFRSVSTQHQRLDGQQQGLNAQQHGVHDADGVDDMQRKALERADFP